MITEEEKRFIDTWIRRKAIDIICYDKWDFDDDSGHWYKVSSREAYERAANIVYDNPEDFFEKELTPEDVDDIKKYVEDNYF